MAKRKKTKKEIAEEARREAEADANLRNLRELVRSDGQISSPPASRYVSIRR